jgi:hypothetical protein
MRRFLFRARIAIVLMRAISLISRQPVITVLRLFLSTRVFPDAPFLTEMKLGSIATLAGGAVAIAVARVLRVGRFA